MVRIGREGFLRMMTQNASRVRWFSISAVLIVADQVLKYAAVTHLTESSVGVLPIFTLRLACNTGAAFSMFEGYSMFLAIAGIALGIFFAYSIYRLAANRIIEGLAFACILGGDIGNVIDRLTRGCVVDFVHLHYESFNFPIFNLADSAITIGALLWISVLFRQSRTSGEELPSNSPSP